MRKYSAYQALFKAPMVRSILNGTKTITRRIVKLPSYHPDVKGKQPADWTVDGLKLYDGNGKFEGDLKCPYGKVGDVMWVRETHQFIKPKVDVHGQRVDTDGAVRYRADGRMDAWDQPSDYNPRYNVWLPSVHLPYEACRLFLKITEVRVERLQDITEEDAIAEGIAFEYPSYYDYLGKSYFYMDTFQYNSPGWDLYRASAAVASYCTLWLSINGMGSWAENPLVWVIRFEKTEKPTNP
jgi:hypothetical protein